MCTEKYTSAPAPAAEPLTKPQAREITDHKLNGLNEVLTITAVDLPGPGGANHAYLVSLPEGSPRPWGSQLVGSFDIPPSLVDRPGVPIVFQNGGLAETGPNGISIEALAAIIIDRLRGFQYGRKEDGTFNEAQRGPFACRENAVALTHFEEGLMWLQKRTLDRTRRGVEGKVVA